MIPVLSQLECPSERGRALPGTLLQSTSAMVRTRPRPSTSRASTSCLPTARWCTASVGIPQRGEWPHFPTHYSIISACEIEIKRIIKNLKESMFFFLRIYEIYFSCSDKVLLTSVEVPPHEGKIILFVAEY